MEPSPEKFHGLIVPRPSLGSQPPTPDTEFQRAATGSTPHRGKARPAYDGLMLIPFRLLSLAVAAAGCAAAQGIPPAGSAMLHAMAPYWLDHVEYQSVDGHWRSGSLQVSEQQVALYRDRGSRYPLAVLGRGTYVDAEWGRRGGWMRTAVLAAATAAGTWVIWDQTRTDPEGHWRVTDTVEGRSYDWTPPARRKHWQWGGVAGAGSLLAFRNWRRQRPRGLIQLSSPQGQVRLRTWPRSRHEALTHRLRLALEGPRALQPGLTTPADVMHPNSSLRPDPRARQAGRQWLR